MDKIEQAAKKKKSQRQTAIALHNFTCHLAFYFRRGGSSLIFQVLIVFFFFNEIVNCDFVRRNLFSSKEAVL